MRELYRPLNLNETPILFTGRRTSELIKYAANAFLAMKITFINEMADLCEAVGADVQQVARGIGLDNRIGRKFLHAGPGLRRLVLPQGHPGPGAHRRRRPARPVRLIETTVAVNDARKKAMADKVADALRRRPGGQDRRHAGPDLQAQHRRHARRPRAWTSCRPCMAMGARGPGLRPRGHARGRPSMLPGVDFKRRPL